MSIEKKLQRAITISAISITLNLITVALVIILLVKG